MEKHRHDLRGLAPGEPEEPTEAWIEYANGGRLDCALERTGPLTWTARPPQVATIQPGDHLRIDRLPAGATVEFVDVTLPQADPDPLG